MIPTIEDEPFRSMRRWVIDKGYELRKNEDGCWTLAIFAEDGDSDALFETATSDDRLGLTRAFEAALDVELDMSEEALDG